MKQAFFLLLILITAIAYSQKQPVAVKVSYQKISLGKVADADNPIIIFSDAHKTLVSNKSIFDGKASFPIEQSLVYHIDSSYVISAEWSKGKHIATRDSVSLKKQSFELLPDTKTILGYKCKKARTIINSNTIEIWYTNDLKLKGAPSLLGQELGLVLETNRNGSYIVTATNLEKLKSIPPAILPAIANRPVDMLTYRDVLWRSRFITLPVFKDEIINFSDASKSNDSILRFANGTIALRKIKFPEINTGSQVFVELKEQSNGDAYDRTGSVFLIPEDQQQSFMDGLRDGATTLPEYDNGNGKKYHGILRTNSYSPLLELMRFFTPFGIKQYGHIQLKGKDWHEIVPYRQDVSELTPLFSNKEMWVGVFIGNYDKGGHKVSLDITIHKDEVQYNEDNFVLPLFNTVNVMEMAGQEYATMFNSSKGLEVTFTLEKDVKNVRLRYITTGHGGWENGDEYLPKKNTITLDGNVAFAFVPWRQDCGSYRLFNPASGNFDNGLSSSDYSRSNWCPGTITNPEFIDLGNLKAGTHTLTVTIPQGAPEGNSFSAWNVSGVLLGEE
ncbi:peptide-N-glycosidase F-related protein [Flavobacterium sp. MFBS3-15]|uniref:PNGase F N-terminal domain-containing protein n=1 Tax=Flavobacterium sp. MFBS3-15 TaxID=2989816 RepID=UPI00223579A2|nr:PNGase F N-terminal domain-containing protein [Flavobacterium sp. MFBS3-15]MCW4467389.1 peptide-N-glycosidase F-related protein [Flavobacterium sp. MFBS3-15]